GAAWVKSVGLAVAAASAAWRIDRCAAADDHADQAEREQRDMRPFRDGGAGFRPGRGRRSEHRQGNEDSHEHVRRMRQWGVEATPQKLMSLSGTLRLALATRPRAGLRGPPRSCGC